MAIDDLPEGTDSIVPGAGAGGSGNTRSDLEPRSAATERADGDTLSANNRAEGFGGDTSDDDGSASGDAPDLSGAKAQLADAAGEARQGIADKIQGLRGQATDRARQLALSGKDRAVDGLDHVAQLIDDAAATVDDKVGAQYGGYVRQAGQAVTNLAEQLRAKDVDELFDDARRVVRASPAVAIGAAAAVGFVVARIVQAGVDSARSPADEKTSA